MERVFMGNADGAGEMDARTAVSTYTCTHAPSPLSTHPPLPEYRNVLHTRTHNATIIVATTISAARTCTHIYAKTPLTPTPSPRAYI